MWWECMCWLEYGTDGAQGSQLDRENKHQRRSHSHASRPQRAPLACHSLSAPPLLPQQAAQPLRPCLHPPQSPSPEQIPWLPASAGSSRSLMRLQRPPTSPDYMQTHGPIGWLYHVHDRAIMEI